MINRRKYRNNKRSKKTKKKLISLKKDSTRAKSDALKKLLEFRVVRFIIAGIINTGFSYGVYVFLLYSGLEYKIANLGALILGVLFSFKTQGKYVFKSTSNKRFFRFILAWAFIYVFNIFIIGEFISLGLNAYIAGGIAIVPVTILSYITQRLFVFADLKILKASLQK